VIELGRACEEEMVLEFLRGEMDSPRYGTGAAIAIAGTGLDRQSLVDNPDLSNGDHNDRRAAALDGIRGYSRRAFLFERFPRDVQWRRVQLEDADMGRLLYAGCHPWYGVSGGTLRVVDAAANLPHDLLRDVYGVDLNRSIENIADSVRRGETHPEIIAVESPLGWLVLVEGHARATAHVLAVRPPSVLIGTSPGIAAWQLYSAPAVPPGI
jgi:hypothetical protein